MPHMPRELAGHCRLGACGPILTSARLQIIHRKFWSLPLSRTGLETIKPSIPTDSSQGIDRLCSMKLGEPLRGILHWIGALAGSTRMGMGRPTGGRGPGDQQHCLSSHWSASTLS